MLLHRKPLDEPRPVELPRAVPATTRRPLPLGAPARSVAALAELRAETSPAAFFNAIDARPIPHANWDAWLADDFDHVNRRHDNFADATSRAFAAFRDAFAYAPFAMVAPLFSDLADFAAALDDDRGAMLADVNAERVLLAELAPSAAKAEVA